MPGGRVFDDFVAERAAAPDDENFSGVELGLIPPGDEAEAVEALIPQRARLGGGLPRGRVSPREKSACRNADVRSFMAAIRSSSC